MNYFKKYSLVLLIVIQLISFQQCSRVTLVEHQEIALKLSSANPFRLGPPIDLPVVRRYVFFVDMSQSMISGPCPFDVDDGPYFGASTPLEPYDKNLEIGNPKDHRASGFDCQIDPSKPIDRSSIQLTVPNIFNGQFYKTTKGLDFEGDRFKVIENWLNSIIEDSVPGSLSETKIMIIPFSGGLIGEALDKKLKQNLNINTFVSFYGIQSESKS
ncbi:MAG TPA: hypothetical protein PLJ21_07665, partial [Pseudobdellovibrionaceae bacterium]|nr:hypothetical protein [Pseudobdellovibrionaceae bacterium]